MRCAPIPLLLFVVACAGSQSPHRDESTTGGPSGRLRLSGELRSVLVEEMHAIERAMPALQSAVQSREMDTVARLGDEIADTFILRQKLSKQQHHELHHSVPKPFLKLDHAFHRQARKLANAARGGDPIAVRDHLEALRAACVQCHQRFR